MFDKTARYYEAIYATMKDYAKEAEDLHDLIQRERPGARSFLDVACGTGLHDSFLVDRYTIAGIDLDPQMLAIASEHNPAVDYRVADMANFDLGRVYDAVACLFSSVAYTVTEDRLYAAIACMAKHVAPGGVLIIEPWILPENWQPGLVHSNFVDQPDLKIARMSLSEPIQDGRGTLVFEYLIATTAGIERATEHHTVGFFTHEQYLGAIEAAGLHARFNPEGGWANRGMYLGTAPRAANPTLRS